MPNNPSSRSDVVEARVWKDFAQLAVEAMAIGIVFSVLLALAVFVVARTGHGDNLARWQPAQTEVHTSVSAG